MIYDYMYICTLDIFLKKKRNIIHFEISFAHEMYWSGKVIAVGNARQAPSRVTSPDQYATQRRSPLAMLLYGLK
jgi:hypothetical protein